jgi:hydroxymethylpyrimidine pyrophosphatase-like HAD family hydrolase
LRLALCSGRPGFGVARDYAERLDADGWHSFQNGASVLNLASGASRSVELSDAVVDMLLDRASRFERTLELYTDTAYAVEQDTPRVRTHAALLGVPFAPRAFASLPRPYVRAQWLLPRDAAAAVIAEPHPGLELSPSTSPVMPDTVFVNMTPAGVTKATAVRAIALSYGIALEQVMFVGDGDNDVPALRIVGHPVAMANAEHAALAAATTVVGHVDDGGLADALLLAATLAFSS